MAKKLPTEADILTKFIASALVGISARWHQRSLASAAPGTTRLVLACSRPMCTPKSWTCCLPMVATAMRSWTTAAALTQPVVLAAPALESARQDLDVQATPPSGQSVGLRMRLGIGDHRWLQHVVHGASSGHDKHLLKEAMAPFMAQSSAMQRYVRRPAETLKMKNPSECTGVRYEPPWSDLGRDHMWSIMTWPNPLHDTWVAPSIRRAKS